MWRRCAEHVWFHRLYAQDLLGPRCKLWHRTRWVQRNAELRDVHAPRDLRRRRHAEPLRVHPHELQRRRSQVRNGVRRVREHDTMWLLSHGRDLRGQPVRLCQRVEVLRLQLHSQRRLLHGRRL